MPIRTARVPANENVSSTSPRRSTILHIAGLPGAGLDFYTAPERDKKPSSPQARGGAPSVRIAVAADLAGALAPLGERPSRGKHARPQRSSRAVTARSWAPAMTPAKG
jgi:hypothetical protein